MRWPALAVVALVSACPAPTDIACNSDADCSHFDSCIDGACGPTPFPDAGSVVDAGHAPDDAGNAPEDAGNTGEGEGDVDAGNAGEGEGEGEGDVLDGVEHEPNDVAAEANALPDVAGDGSSPVIIAGSLGSADDVDVFRFHLLVDRQPVYAHTLDGDGLVSTCPDTHLSLYAASDPSTLLLQNDDGSFDGCSAVALDSLLADDYLIEVSTFGGPPDYQLVIESVPPTCGDNAVQSSERCEDGNRDDGDGCSAACTVEDGNQFEDEPDDTAPQATRLDLGTGHGVVADNQDDDYWQVRLFDDASTLTMRTAGAFAAACDVDTFIEWRDSNNNLLDQDDDSGGNGCSLLVEHNVVAGTYYIVVSGASGGPYRLLTSVQ